MSGKTHFEKRYSNKKREEKDKNIVVVNEKETTVERGGV